MSNNGKQTGAIGGGPQPGSGVEKPKNLGKTLKRILDYSNKYLPIIIVAFACAIAATILMLLGPSRLSDLTNIIKDGLTGSIDMDSIVSIASMLVIFYALSWILNCVQGWILATTTQKISYSMRKDISRKINRIPMSYYSKVSTGDILSRVTNDVDTIGQSLNNSLGTLVSSITLLIGSLIIMFITNWLMAITAIAASLIGFILMLIIMSKSQKYFDIQQAAIGDINGQVEEVYSGHIVIKAYNDEEHVKKEFNQMNDTLEGSAFKA